MADFLKFWFDCIIEGFHFADGLFAIIEGVCIFIGAVLHWHDKIPILKKYTKKWDVWEKAVMKWAVAICLVSFFISTVFVAPFLTYEHENKAYKASEKSVADLLQSNAFFNGQIQGESNLVINLQKELEDNKHDSETALLNLKTDLNEANRQKDVALQRLDYFESNPEKLSEIYSNIFSHAPTSFEQFDSMFAKFNGAISNLSEIEIETKKIQNSVAQPGLSTEQLSDLDIEKLPDGRMKIGDMITGKPTIVIQAFREGFQRYTNGDFDDALADFQKAIKAQESMKALSPDAPVVGNYTTPEGNAELYGIAGQCALIIHSNNIADEYMPEALEYAQEAVRIRPSPENKFNLSLQIARSAAQKISYNDLSGAFELLQKAIVNYEMIEGFDLKTNLNEKSQMMKLYALGAKVASIVGRTNEMSDWKRKLATMKQ